MQRFKASVTTIYIITILVLAVSTFLSQSIYGSWWFVSLWAVISLFLVVSMAKTKLWKRIDLLIIHLSFLFILAGGLMTWMSGVKGSVRLLPGDTATTFVDEQGYSHPLPSPVRLDSFVVDYYDGMVAPRDFSSYITINGKQQVVSMNKIVDDGGFRYYQTSYDSSGSSTLTVNHDPWGIALTYIGYLTFALGAVIFLANPKGRYRKIFRSAFTIIALATAMNVGAVNGVSRQMADSLSTKQVLFNGRIAPFNTVARDFSLKVTGTASFRGLSPEQLVTSLVLFPDEWNTQPLILVKDKGLRSKLGLSSKYATIANLFDSNGNYRLKAYYKGGSIGSDRAILDVDEKMELIMMLRDGTLFTELPIGAKPLSDTAVNAEILYNKINFNLSFAIVSLIVAVLGFIALRDRKKFGYAIFIIAILLVVFQLGGYSLRWYISGHIPLSSGSETLQFLSIAIAVVSVFLGLKNRILLSTGLLAAAFCALVAYLGDKNPTITPLVPVLASPWLCIHVTIVMLAYSLLTFTFINAIIALIFKGQAAKMRAVSLALILPGLLLLGLGIFTGAIWANVSWGRYWGWDPKETWALITLLTYAIPIHLKIKDKTFHILCLIAFATVVMTYLGVNYLPSLHSYAS